MMAVLLNQALQVKLGHRSVNCAIVSILAGRSRNSAPTVVRRQLKWSTFGKLRIHRCWFRDR